MRIELDDLPIPRKGHPLSVAGDTARKMRVGESVLCKTKSEWETLRRAIRDFGGKAVSRRMTTGWRVWRVE